MEVIKMNKKVNLVVEILLAAAVIPVIILIYTFVVSKYGGSIVTALSSLFKF
jgi:hypothetical protein